MGVEPGPGRRAAERDLADPAQRALDPLDAEPHLRGVAAELLAEGDRDRVHQMRAARLDDIGEALGLGAQRLLQPLHRRQQVVGDLAQGGEVDRRGEDVIGRLAHVDVVVGMGRVAGELGDHLVGVHVRGGAGAGLEDVDRELVVVFAGGDRVARFGDLRGEIRVEPAELAVGPRRGGLEPAEPAHDRNRNRLAGNREVVNRFRRLAAPQLLAHVNPPSSRYVPAAYSAALVAGVEATLIRRQEGRRQRPVVGAVAGGGGEAVNQLVMDPFGPVSPPLRRSEQVAEA